MGRIWRVQGKDGDRQWTNLEIKEKSLERKEVSSSPRSEFYSYTIFNVSSVLQFNSNVLGDSFPSQSS